MAKKVVVTHKAVATLPSTNFERFLRLGGRYAGTISVIAFLLSVIWFAAFPLVCVTTGELKCRGTYLSENALISNGHNVEILASNKYKRYIPEFARVLENSGELLTSKILSELRNIPRTESFLHRSGTIYSLLKPWPAGDRKEAMILCTILDEQKATLISSVVAQMSLLSTVKWSSKNVYVLITPNHMALQEWLHDYHNDAAADIHRAGMLIGAFILDLGDHNEGGQGNALTLMSQGINGQLPNLDLINVAIRVPHPQVAIQVVRPMVDSITLAKNWIRRNLPWGWSTDFQVEQYFNSVEHLLHYAHRVAFGPTGLHGIFISHGVEAVTLFWDKGENNDWYYLDMLGIAESTLHSLSNLSEKLHQSFYLYMLTTSRQFVSIEEYNWSLILLLLPFAMNALRMLYGTNSKGDSSFTSSGLAMMGATIVAGYSLCCGCLLMYLSTKDGWQTLSSNAMLFDVLKTLESKLPGVPLQVVVWWVAYVIILLGSLFVVFPLIKTFISQYSNEKAAYWQPLKLLVMFGIYVSHAMLGMVCFPFAFLSALICVPVYYNLQPRSILSGLLLLGTMLPLQVIALRLMVIDDTYWMGDGNAGTLVTDVGIETLESLAVHPVLVTLFESLGLLMTGFQTIGTFHLGYLCALHLPAHLISFAILFAEV